MVFGPRSLDGSGGRVAVQRGDIEMDSSKMGRMLSRMQSLSRRA